MLEEESIPSAPKIHEEEPRAPLEDGVEAAKT